MIGQIQVTQLADVDARGRRARAPPRPSSLADARALVPRARRARRRSGRARGARARAGRRPRRRRARRAPPRRLPRRDGREPRQHAVRGVADARRAHRRRRGRPAHPVEPHRRPHRHGRPPRSRRRRCAGDGVRRRRQAADAAIAAASRFAELDPYRAATHNKGIMNGVDAVLRRDRPGLARGRGRRARVRRPQRRATGRSPSGATTRDRALAGELGHAARGRHRRRRAARPPRRAARARARRRRHGAASSPRSPAPPASPPTSPRCARSPPKASSAATWRCTPAASPAPPAPPASSSIASPPSWPPLGDVKPDRAREVLARLSRERAASHLTAGRARMIDRVRPAARRPSVPLPPDRSSSTPATATARRCAARATTTTRWRRCSRARALRKHIFALFAFARVADDFADEAALRGPPRPRARSLGRAARTPLPRPTPSTRCSSRSPTPSTSSRCRSPSSPSCCPGSGPTSSRRYATFDELRSYTAPGRRAGRPPPALHRRLSRARAARASPTIWPPASRSRALPGRPGRRERGRVYLPAEDLRHFGVDRADLAARARVTRRVGDLVRYEVARTRALFERARPLVDVVGADLAVELALLARRHAHPRQDRRRRREACPSARSSTNVDKALVLARARVAWRDARRRAGRRFLRQLTESRS